MNDSINQKHQSKQDMCTSVYIHPVGTNVKQTMTDLRKSILTLTIVTIFLTTTSCQDNFVRREIPIDRIDTSGVYVTYFYNDKEFQKRFELGFTTENFYDLDSMVIRINKTNPEEVQFESIIHRKWPKEDAIIELKEK
jgi:hypothetical protein